MSTKKIAGTEVGLAKSSTSVPVNSERFKWSEVTVIGDSWIEDGIHHVEYPPGNLIHQCKYEDGEWVLVEGERCGMQDDC